VTVISLSAPGHAIRTVPVRVVVLLGFVVKLNRAVPVPLPGADTSEMKDAPEDAVQGQPDSTDTLMSKVPVR
jgi:hypothetical protein